MADIIRVAIVYHYWALYREPIVRQLCMQVSPDPEYTLISGIKGETDDQAKIVTIDPNKANIPISNGGLRWSFVKNIWVGKLFLWQTGLLRLSFSKKYDVIIYLGSMYFISTWLSAIMARLCGKKILMWTHGFLREDNSLKEYIRKLFYRISNGFLLYGNRARNIMIKKGFDGNVLHVIYNSLNYDTQRNVRNSMVPDSLKLFRRSKFKYHEYPILIFIGRLMPDKLLGMIIDSAKQLHMNGIPVNILFIGGGPDEARLKSKVTEYNLDDYALFCGPCYDENELGLLIMSSDICISPGNVGLTAIHAMTYGKPVITHDKISQQMPEYESIIQGKTGSFFRHGDLNSLTSTIAEWIEGERYSKASSDCISIIEKYYNPHTQVELINSAVKDVLMMRNE